MSESKPIPAPPLPAKPGSSSSVPGAVVKNLPLSEIPSTPSAAAPAPSSEPAPSGLSASELMQQAQDEMTQGDWTGARQTLDEVKAKNPDEENLWSGYGVIAAAQQRDFEEAEADFRKEVAAHPDNVRAVAALSSAQSRNGNAAGAQKTLQQYLARNPGNVQITFMLAGLERSAGDFATELKTLESAADQDPDNREIRVQESEALVRLNRNEEAAAAAKSALDGADDPGVLNDAAYELSESGLDLDVAEDASRRSVEKQEEKSAQMTTEQANTNAFFQANLLIASWDTLGWILFREGKTDAAIPYLSAAWRAGLQAEVGDHLAQVYESQDRKDDALTAYVLAQAAVTRDLPPDVRAHIEDGVRRLKAAGAKPGAPNPTKALQDLRTFKVAKPAGASGWGAFRLEVTAAGVIEAQKMSGEPSIAAIKPVLEQMKLPGLLPPDSKAHLLRSAVVSCSMGKTCDVVLVPDGGLQTEQQ